MNWQSLAGWVRTEVIDQRRAEIRVVCPSPQLLYTWPEAAHFDFLSPRAD
ncbi:MAG: hypothetical protein ACUVTH_00680 [Thermogutta sp.]